MYKHIYKNNISWVNHFLYLIIMIVIIVVMITVSFFFFTLGHSYYDEGRDLTLLAEILFPDLYFLFLSVMVLAEL